jgi:hypothetical protein
VLRLVMPMRDGAWTCVLVRYEYPRVLITASFVYHEDFYCGDTKIGHEIVICGIRVVVEVVVGAYDVEIDNQFILFCKPLVLQIAAILFSSKLTIV